MDSIKATAPLERILEQRVAWRREHDEIAVLARVASEELRVLLGEMQALGTTPETLLDDLEADRREAALLHPQYVESLTEWRCRVEAAQRLYGELRGTG